MDDLSIKRLYGPNTKEIGKNQETRIYQTTHQSGWGSVEQYSLFSGIDLTCLPFVGIIKNVMMH